MKSILNVTYPATFKFTFTKSEIKGGEVFMNSYGIRQTFEVKSHADLEKLIRGIAKKVGINPSAVDYEILS